MLISGLVDKVHTCHMQVFLLAAMKLHCYLAAMPQSAPTDGICLLAAIDSSLQHMLKLIRRQEAAALARYGGSSRSRVREAELHWLALTAFRQVLHRKQVNSYIVLLTRTERESRRDRE